MTPPCPHCAATAAERDMLKRHYEASLQLQQRDAATAVDLGRQRDELADLVARLREILAAPMGGEWRLTQASRALAGAPTTCHTRPAAQAEIDVATWTQALFRREIEALTWASALIDRHDLGRAQREILARISRLRLIALKVRPA